MYLPNVLVHTYVRTYVHMKLSVIGSFFSLPSRCNKIPLGPYSPGQIFPVLPAPAHPGDLLFRDQILCGEKSRLEIYQMKWTTHFYLFPSAQVLDIIAADFMV